MSKSRFRSQRKRRVLLLNIEARRNFARSRLNFHNQKGENKK
jgi:hypothetical protein